MTTKPLEGIRVIEMGQLLAGPFAGCLLGYFGAEVIKIEPPGGDPIRRWRVMKGDTSLWWRSLARNKKCVTLDLAKPRGRELAGQLIEGADVLIENFRPGVMEKWGLGPEVFKASHPQLIYTRISGYGQTGPYATKAGFASVCEAFSGFRYVNGFPGEAPVRPNLSIGDTISGMHAALGICMSLIARQRHDVVGQVVDVALFESMFNLLEAVVPEYDGAGVVREPSGTTVTGIVPTNTYRCSDDKYVVIGGNGDSIFQRLMAAAGKPELGADSKYATNPDRVQHEQELDKVLATWCAQHPASEILGLLEQHRVPAGPIYSVEDMFGDPQYQARELFEEVSVDGEPLAIPAILPRLTATPGGTEWPGAEIGSHNDEVFGEQLKLGEAEYAQLRADGVI